MQETSRWLIASSLFLPFLSLSSFAQSGKTVPSVQVSVYAAIQTKAPVRVVGFHYQIGEIDVDLLNESQKTVSAVALLIGGLGCARKNERTCGVGGGLTSIHLEPNGRGTLSGLDSPFSPASLAGNALGYKLSRVIMQTGVMEVHFDDGTVWNSPPRLPFDPSPVAPGSCPESDALSSVSPQQYRAHFQQGTPAQAVAVKRENGPPIAGLSFSCEFTEDEVSRNVEFNCPKSEVTSKQPENN
jgi:hypothetical protein